MDELKSAWEIAQQRANRLGNLSAQEKEQQERQGLRQIGQALAQKYLGSPRQWDMITELDKYEERERDFIKQGIIEHLLKAIEFPPARGIDSVKRAIEAISSLGPELQPKAEEMSQLVQEYEGAEQEIRQELESNYKETLHQLRISGTAVDAVNIESNPKWQVARQGLVEGFTRRLNDLKQALIR
jgi:hypothetical protein